MNRRKYDECGLKFITIDLDWQQMSKTKKKVQKAHTNFYVHDRRHALSFEFQMRDVRGTK